MKISAVIIAFNEEAKIADALRSVDWADEVLVVDSGSTDRTRTIAEGHGARVIEQPWLGFSAQKQFATESAEHDWILSLDADERVSEDLRSSILRLKEKGEDSIDGFRIARLSFYLGRPVRHGGWYPDWQLRLFDRRRGRWKNVPVHESFELNGPGSSGRLEGDIIHFSVDDASHHHRMIGERYAPLAAQRMFEEGRRTGLFRIMIAGPAAFLQTYVLKLGFLDGLAGYAIARFAGHHAFLKHLLLWEKQRSR